MKHPAGKRLVLLTFAVLLCLSQLSISASASGNLSTEPPTKSEIQAKWKEVTSATTLYEEEPSVVSPYCAGTLSESFLQSGLTYLNYVRFVANLPAVQLNDTLNEDAQHGAVLLAAIDQLTHYPSQPDDMDDTFYSRGASATRSSNISARYGYSPLTCLQSATSGCMADSSSVSNLSRLGHRRWLLNPTLLNVGFGYAQAASGWSYIVTKVFDRSGSSFDYDYISWPASGNLPTNLFATTTPWSITLNPSKYLTPSANLVQITITRESDGKTWSFDSSTGAPASTSAAYMTVDTAGYGVSNCIIFHPGSANIDAYEGVFTVDVSGIYTVAGAETTLHYEVDFFDINGCYAHSLTAVVTDATCTEDGYSTYTCALCGYAFQGDIVTAPGHIAGEEWLYDRTEHWNVCHCGETLQTGQHTYEGEASICTVCGFDRDTAIPGDLNNDKSVDNADVSLLLWHTLFPEIYTITGDADFNGDAQINDADVACLLWHILYPTTYPL